jgi:hypothetical protein
VPAPVNYVVIRSSTASVSALLDDTTATITDGYGGWQEVQRARRTAYVDWPGKNTLKMTFGIVFDGFADDGDVSGAVKRLESMALPGGGTTKPPIVHIVGAVPHTELDWVISKIDWGETLRNSRGIMVRQKMTITFWQFVPEDIIVKSPAAKNKNKNKTAGQKGQSERVFTRDTYGYVPDPAANAVAATLYVTQAGDTLTSIAASQLGDWQRWTEIADLNNLADPFAEFAGGEHIKVPSE